MSIETTMTRAWQRQSFWLWLLLPVSGLYGLITMIRHQAYKVGLFSSYRAPIPVMVIGNITVGGSGKTREVLDKVGEKMKCILKPLDYAVLPSDGKSIRWRNSAQWARNTMVNEDGRMKKSPSGIWEISRKGREWLLAPKAED